VSRVTCATNICVSTSHVKGKTSLRDCSR